jgi:hypothetical protein
MVEAQKRTDRIRNTALSPFFVPGTGRESTWMRTWNSGGRRRVAPSTIRRSAPARTSPSPWSRSSGLARQPNGRHGCPPPHVDSWSVLRIRFRDPVLFWLRDPGWVKNQDPDPGWKISDPGSGIIIPDPQHCSWVWYFWGLYPDWNYFLVFLSFLSIFLWFEGGSSVFLVTAPFWLICRFYLLHDIW